MYFVKVPSFPLNVTALDALAELRTCEVRQWAHTRFVQLAKSLEHIYRTWAPASLFVSLSQWTVPSMEAHSIVCRIRMHMEHLSLQSGEGIICLYMCVNVCVWVQHLCAHMLKSICVTLCIFTVIIVLYKDENALYVSALFSHQKKKRKMPLQKVYERFRLCIFSMAMKMRVFFGAKELITAFSWANSYNVKKKNTARKRKAKRENQIVAKSTNLKQAAPWIFLFAPEGNAAFCI